MRILKPDCQKTLTVNTNLYDIKMKSTFYKFLKKRILLTMSPSNCDRGINNVLLVLHNDLFVPNSIDIKNNCSVYLGLNHSLWNIVHGIGKPTFKAFCKIANGLGQGTYV